MHVYYILSLGNFHQAGRHKVGGSIGKNEADAAGGRVTEGILKRCTNLFVGDSNIKGDVQHLNRGLPHKDNGVEES